MTRPRSFKNRAQKLQEQPIARAVETENERGIGCHVAVDGKRGYPAQPDVGVGRALIAQPVHPELWRVWAEDRAARHQHRTDRDIGGDQHQRDHARAVAGL
jgi:hypothetical protein